IIPESLQHNVSFLHVQHGQNWEAIGTAFHLNIVDGDHIFTYVVTCKHVVQEARKKNPKQEIYMRLNRSDTLGVGYSLIEGDWVYHDDKAVDVAVAPLIPGGRPLGIGAYDVPNGLLTRKEELEKRIRIPLGY